MKNKTRKKKKKEIKFLKWTNELCFFFYRSEKLNWREVVPKCQKLYRNFPTVESLLLCVMFIGLMKALDEVWGEYDIRKRIAQKKRRKVKKKSDPAKHRNNVGRYLGSRYSMGEVVRAGKKNVKLCVDAKN